MWKHVKILILLNLQPLDPSISVYKGYGLSKETESYLLSRGLQQAGFSISACDLQDGLFGCLSICPFQVRNFKYYVCLIKLMLLLFDPLSSVGWEDRVCGGESLEREKIRG